MNITTRPKGKSIVASGTVHGKRRQLTVPVDPDKGRNRNHGSAAGRLVAKHADHDEQRRLDQSIITGKASWKGRKDGTFVFTFPDKD